MNLKLSRCVLRVKYRPAGRELSRYFVRSEVSPAWVGNPPAHYHPAGRGAGGDTDEDEEVAVDEEEKEEEEEEEEQGEGG